MPEAITGAAGQPLALRVLGSSRGELVFTTGDERVMRFELLGADGSPADTAQISSATVRARLSADPGSVLVSVGATQDTVTGSDGEDYSWAASLVDLLRTGRWSLDVAVSFIDGVDTVWPQPGPFYVLVRGDVG
jgi:hypothetical protein